MRRKHKKKEERTRINSQIRSEEVRVLTEDGENLGVMSSSEALDKAYDMGLDLIEISPNAKPPIVKIADYGKFKYDQKKKAKETKAKTKTTETKNIQVKIGTGEGDMILKAKNISTWLSEGNRVKLDLFLPGRAKYLEKGFLEERLKRILLLVTEPHKIADGPKKSPKGLTLILEKASKKDLKEQDDVENSSAPKKKKDENK